MKRKPLFAACLGALVCCVPLQACLNDRDSDLLEREARGLPDVMRVITGRFERNPPLFYQMRLQRVERELKRDPNQLALYDDAAVASDRLGKDDKALGWIEARRKLLPPFDAKNKAMREQWYRYYANAGTFRAHKWIRDGANRQNIGEMKHAASDIARAIDIKPNAHFGREKYQLKAMRWIIAPPPLNDYGAASGFFYESGTKIMSLPTLLGWNPQQNDYTSDLKAAQEELKKEGMDDAVEGLAGLVVLGNAWESLDVFYALQTPLMIQGKGSLLALTRLRCRELLDQGKVSLYPKAFTRQELTEAVAPSYDWRIRSYTPQKMREIYTRLRTEAEEYQSKRTSYMMARLEKGAHPDTDPSFWNEWRDQGPPPAAPYSFWEKHGLATSIIGGALLLSLFLLRARRTRRVAVAV